jgi:hypothetical protein
VDVGFGADVNAHGGTVEYHYLGVCSKPFCKHHALLVTARQALYRQLARRCNDAQFIDPLARAFTHLGMLISFLLSSMLLIVAAIYYY